MPNDVKRGATPARPGIVVWQPTGESPPEEGPPRGYSEELHRQIVSLLSEGYSFDHAANVSRTTPRTVREWMRRGRDGNVWLAQFAEDVDQACAFAAMKLEKVVLSKAGEDADLGLKVLERRDPKNWNKEQKITVASQITPFLDWAAKALPESSYGKILEYFAETAGAGALAAAEGEDQGD